MSRGRGRTRRGGAGGCADGCGCCLQIVIAFVIWFWIGVLLENAFPWAGVLFFALSFLGFICWMCSTIWRG